MFWKKNKGPSKDEENRKKILESQKALVDAATATAEIANIVTGRLKENLEDSIRQFQLTAKILNDALIVCTDDGTIHAYNPAAEILFGWSSEEILTRKASDLFVIKGENISDPEYLWNYLQDNEYENVVMGKSKDNSIFEIDYNFDTLDRSNDTNIKLLVIHKKNVEKKISEATEYNYRSIFEKSFDGILIQQDNKIVATNHAMIDLLGYSNKELLGKDIISVINYHDHNKKGKVTEAYHQSGLSLTVLYSTTQIFYENKIANLIIVKDISERKELEDRLIKNFDAQLICVMDQNLNIVFANHHFSKKYKMKMIGKNIKDVLSDYELQPFLLNISSLNPDHPTRSIQYQTDLDINGDGSMDESRVYYWTDHAAYDSDGNIVEYQRIGRDITQIISDLFK